eukprot:TRINITY_DN2459_c0_g1_i4.p1 TRINITY_DN2459_c0_g1~~TRINITY_DN2459_c0_g1_i4.p1  ORF type:complete len:1131 (-),score=308.75 TRINITY_DN2459_c0_g1_i4:586-3732(-)
MVTIDPLLKPIIEVTDIVGGKLLQIKCDSNSSQLFWNRCKSKFNNDLILCDNGDKCECEVNIAEVYDIRGQCSENGYETSEVVGDVVTVLQAPAPIVSCIASLNSYICTSECAEGISYVMNPFNKQFVNETQVILNNEYLELDGIYSFESECRFIGKSISELGSFQVIEVIPSNPIIDCNDTLNGLNCTIDCPDDDSLLWLSNPNDINDVNTTHGLTYQNEFVKSTIEVFGGQCRRHGFISDLISRDINLDSGTLSFEAPSEIVKESSNEQVHSITIFRSGSFDTKICISLIAECAIVTGGHDICGVVLKKATQDLNSLDQLCWNHLDNELQKIHVQIAGNEWFYGNQQISIWMDESLDSSVIGTIPLFTLSVEDDEIVDYGFVQFQHEIDTVYVNKVDGNSVVIPLDRVGGNTIASTRVVCQPSDGISCSLTPEVFYWHPKNVDIPTERSFNLTINWLNPEANGKVKLTFEDLNLLEESLEMGNLTVIFDHIFPSVAIVTPLSTPMVETLSKLQFQCTEPYCMLNYNIFIGKCHENVTYEDISNATCKSTSLILKAEPRTFSLAQDSITFDVLKLFGQDEGFYCFEGFVFDRAGNPSNIINQFWTIDRSAPMIEWVETPLKITSSVSASFEFNMFDQNEFLNKTSCGGNGNGITEGKCVVSCILDDGFGKFVDNCQNEGKFNATQLTTGEHTLNISIRDTLMNNAQFSFEWSIVRTALGVNVESDDEGEDTQKIDPDKFLFEVDEFGSMEKFSLELPIAPFDNEIVEVRCSSSDESEVKVTPSSIPYTRYTYQAVKWFTITGMTDKDNVDVDEPFDVDCIVSSYGAPTLLYDGSPEINLHGFVRNVVHPRVGDILVHRNEDSNTTTTYESSITEDNEFSLTISGGETLTFVGDDEFNGIKFDEQTTLSLGALEFEIIDKSYNSITVKIQSIADNDDLVGTYVPFSFTNPNEFKHNGDETENGLLSLGTTSTCPDKCPFEAKQGIFITKTCVGDFASGFDCLDAEKSKDCGFGVGTTCKKCADFPEGSICPGTKGYFSIKCSRRTCVL